MTLKLSDANSNMSHITNQCSVLADKNRLFYADECERYNLWILYKPSFFGYIDFFTLLLHEIARKVVEWQGIRAQIRMINITNKFASDFIDNYSVNLYSILLFEGKCSFVVDGNSYHSTKPTILFLSPYQSLKWVAEFQTPIRTVQFHGDFYCIEYHKKRACLQWSAF